MCNKYAQQSKVQKYKNAELVSQINHLEVEKNDINPRCLKCANTCLNVCNMFNDNSCDNFRERYSLNKLNEQLKIQNVDLRRLCKDNGLKYKYMMDMLNGKIHMKFKYYACLEDRLCEDEFDEYITRFDEV